MSKNNCRFFYSCNAPLCPLMEQDGIWFPDEEICRKKSVPGWVRKQKKIQKKTNGDFSRGLFTVRMLNEIKGVGKAVAGLSPDTHKKVSVHIRSLEKMGGILHDLPAIDQNIKEK